LPVQLVPLLGAYELSFPFSGVIHEKSDGLYRALTVDGARVIAKSKGGLQTDMGFARPDTFTQLRQSDTPGRTNVTLKIILQPHQVELLDRERDGEGLAFVLRMSLRGSDSKNGPLDWPEHVEINLPVSQSEWIAQLNAAKAGHVLLFEVKLPIADGAAARQPALKHLTLALDLMRPRNWRQCVAQCRQFAEELGGDSLSGALKELATDRKAMTKESRESALLAGLQHYAHLAAHSERQLGTMEFERRDAKLALSLAAVLAEHHFGG